MAIISACLPTLAPLFRMNRTGLTSRGTPSGQNELSKSGSKHFPLFSASRSKGHEFHSDDDEVELTCGVASGEASGGTCWSKGSGGTERGITVETLISVTRRDREDTRSSG